MMRLLCVLFVLCFLALGISGESNLRRRAPFARKLMQSSESTEATSGLSSESEDIPSYSFTSGVTESYRNWDGETDGLVGSASSFFKTLGSILGGTLGIALIIGVIALIVVGVIYLVKKRKAKQQPSGSAYVLMEDDKSI